MAKVTAVSSHTQDCSDSYLVKNADNELHQNIFPTNNARLLSKSAVFAMWTHVSPVVGGFQGDHGKPVLLFHAVQKRPPALCNGPPMVTQLMVGDRMRQLLESSNYPWT